MLSHYIPTFTIMRSRVLSSGVVFRAIGDPLHDLTCHLVLIVIMREVAVVVERQDEELHALRLLLGMATFMMGRPFS